MRKIRIAITLTMTLVIGLVLSACANKGAKMDMSVASSAPQVHYDEDVAKEEAGSAVYTSNTGLTSTTDLAIGNTDNLSMEKIITKVNLEVETQDFDNLINTIKDEITRLGGYDERTEVSGKRY